MSLSTPLKLKGTQGDLQQLNSTEENYLAYLAGTQLAASAGSDPGDLTLVVDGHNIVGTFVDTYFNQGVGTHPASAITSGSTTTTVYQRNGTASESSSDFRRPVAYNDGQIVEMNDTQFNSLVDRLNGRIASSDYVGVFKLGSSSPGADYTVYSTGVFSDTDTAGTVTTYNLYRRTSMTAPSSVKIMAIKRSSGATGDYQGVQEMTDAQAQYSLGQRAKTRRGVDSNIGSYKLRTSSQGAPSTGTWRAVGTATNTKKSTLEIAYTRDRTSTFSRNRNSAYLSSTTADFLANYVGNYIKDRAETFTGNYTKEYLGDYTANYVQNVQVTRRRIRETPDTSSTFLANYLGNFVRDRDSTFSRERSQVFVDDYTGNYVRERDESRAGAYTANYTGDFAGEFLGNYTGTYVGNYIGNFEKNVTRSYTGDYIGDYIREYFRDVGYNREFFRADAYFREVLVRRNTYFRETLTRNQGFTRTVTSTSTTAFTYDPAGNAAVAFTNYADSGAYQVYWGGTQVITGSGSIASAFGNGTIYRLGSDGAYYSVGSVAFSDSKLNTKQWTVSRRTTTSSDQTYFRNYFRAVGYSRDFFRADAYFREVLTGTQTYFRNQFARDVNVRRERRATRSYTGDYIDNIDFTRNDQQTRTAVVTRTRRRDRTANFFRNFVRTFEGDIAKNFVRNDTRIFVGDRVVSYQGSATRDRTAVTSSTFVGNFTGDFVGDYIEDRAANVTRNFARNIAKNFVGDFSRDVLKDRTATFTANYEGNYTRVFEGNYSRLFTGNYIGTTIQGSRETIETYTLYVRTA